MACQEQFLLDLVRSSKGTVFGKQHSFSSIRSAGDFLNRVSPKTCDDFSAWIDAIVQGEKNVLFPGRPVCFATTTGTEGEAKLIPLNRTQLRSTRKSAIDAALLGGLRCGSMSWYRGKMLYIGPRQGRKLRQWVVYAEGTAYAYLQPRILTAWLVPKYGALPMDNQAQDWSVLSQLTRQHQITAVAGNPLEIVAFALSAGIVMPGVKIVFNCGYWATDHLHVYAQAFPNAEVVDVYGSNEGTYGLPVSAGRFLLNYRRMFFSFLPFDGGNEAVGLGDVESGRKYRVCTTTAGGLWNYHTGDAVSFVSLRPPVVKLCGRANRTLSLAGEQVTEDEVVTAVRAAGVRNMKYVLAPGERKYVLYLDGQTADAAAVDGQLRSINSSYGKLRQTGELEQLNVCRRSLDAPQRGKPARIVNDPHGLAGL